jgi:DNA-binding Lrp family transcriptional regulator
MGFKYYGYTGKSRRPSPSEIGRKLGVDEKTVRLRTRKMESVGFIQYYQGIPNPALFGRALLFTYGFKAPGVLGKQSAIRLLKDADGIIDIADFLGEMCGPTLAASSEEDAEREIQRIGKQVGFPGMKFMPPRPFPPARASPDKIDWGIIKALRYDALRRTEQVAKELGITYRMTEYRISKLLDSQSLFIRAILNSKDSKGIVFYSLMLELEKDGNDAQLKQKIINAFSERTWWSLAPPGPMMVLNLFATSIGETEDTLMDVSSRPGIRTASVVIFKGWVEPTRPNWIDRILEERAAAS